MGAEEEINGKRKMGIFMPSQLHHAHLEKFFPTLLLQLSGEYDR